MAQPLSNDNTPEIKHISKAADEIVTYIDNRRKENCFEWRKLQKQRRRSILKKGKREFLKSLTEEFQK